MKYILLINVPATTYQHEGWPKGDLEAHYAYWKRLNAGLEAAGELVAVEALTAPSQGKIVRAGAGAQPITDGVFPESKEFLAGYWIVDVESAARAYAIAADASAAPGPGGKPLDMPIEVREVMSPMPREL